MWQKNLLPWPEAELELFEDLAEVGRWKIFLVGLSLRSPSGDLITASAAGLTDYPKQRAFYELVERAWLWQLRDQIDIEKEGGQSWKLSLSNGVAFGMGKEDASRRALYELVERDRVLRSWYGEFQPKIIDVQEKRYFDECLNHQVEHQILHFGTVEVGSESIETIGIYATSDRRPPIMAWGAGPTIKDAIIKAKSEYVQRLGFLFQEEWGDIPDASTTPDFHLAYYFRPEATQWIEEWLHRPSGMLGSYEKINPSEISFEKLWQSQEGYSLVRASSSKLLPLTFGPSYPSWYQPKVVTNHPHPIC